MEEEWNIYFLLFKENQEISWIFLFRFLFFCSAYYLPFPLVVVLFGVFPALLGAVFL